GARADPGDADELAEGAALFAGGEAVEVVRVLAHHEMREEAHGLAVRRQRVERAHRHAELVGDAADIDEHLRRLLRREASGKPADQTSLPLRMRRPRVARRPSCAPCAWQIAQASASAASAEGSPGRSRSRRTMCCTCSFAAWPLPTTDCFTCNAVYSATGRPAMTAAQIAVPRAWPSARVDCGLTLTKTFSTATWTGACAAITSARPSRIAFRRTERSPSPDFTQPLLMYRRPDAWTSITPNPVSLRPGSMPRILSRSPPWCRRSGRRRGSRARRPGCACAPSDRRRA